MISILINFFFQLLFLQTYNQTNKNKSNRKNFNSTSNSTSNNNNINNGTNEDEETYCTCEQISYGQMICCDNKSCKIQWFHFNCVKLNTKPKGKWYCPMCRGDTHKVMKKSVNNTKSNHFSASNFNQVISQKAK